MERPDCTKSMTALAFTIVNERNIPVPVSLAGYRIRPNKQYALRIQSVDPAIKIENVLLQYTDAVTVQDRIDQDKYFDVRFTIDDGGPPIPFRLIRGIHWLRADVTYAKQLDAGKDSQPSQTKTLQIPILIMSLSFFKLLEVSVIGFLFSSGGAVLAYLFRLMGFPIPIALIWGLLIGLLCLWFIGAALWYQFVLVNRGKIVRAGVIDKERDDA